MKRLLLLLGPVVAIIGSLGLVVFGNAVVGVVLDIFTFRFVDPPAPPPAALAELEWAVTSAMALVVGLVITCVAMVKRGGGQTISTIGRLFYTGAGVSLIVGTISLAWGITGAKESFRNIATSASTPTAESVQEMIQSAELQMTIGYGMSVLSAVLLLAAGLAGLQARPSQANDPRTPLSAVITLGSITVGVVLVLLIISIWFNGNALGTIITETTVAPKPAELASHLWGILSKSLFVFVGLGVLALLQLLASLFLPLATPDAGSEV